MDKDVSVGAVLRAYNNDRVVRQIEALAQTGLVKKIVVVTDPMKDKEDGDYTGRIVGEHIRDKATPNYPEVHYAKHSAYTWSNALNLGVDILIGRLNPVDRVFCLSNEVEFGGREGLKALLKASAQPDSSSGFALYEGRNEPTYQLPRNTCTLWKAEHLSEFHRETGHYFDTLTDKTGGMEDVLTALRLYARAAEKGERRVPMVSTIKAGVEIPDSKTFAQKMKNEETSLAAIYGLKEFSPQIVHGFLASIRDNAPKAQGAAYPDPKRPLVANGLGGADKNTNG